MNRKEASFKNLGKNLQAGSDYLALVEGELPSGLRGSLYRLGPGIFERRGNRKKNLLDGDGLMQSFEFGNGQVRYRNRFVETRKYLDEEVKGEFLYNTWTTNAPHHRPLQNPLSKMLSQAGISPKIRDGLLYAFDDIGQPTVMNPESLETYGESRLGDYRLPNINAHSITDGANGDWILFGHEYGYRLKIHMTILGADGRTKLYRRIPCPRLTYMHDFFATENYVVFCLSAMKVRPLPFLLGFRSFTDSWAWDKGAGNLLCIVDKRNPDQVRFLPVEARWVWHTLNAFESGNTIIADFCGYDDFAHFSGSGAQLETVMDGKVGDPFAEGNIRRYRIDLNRNQVSEELLFQGNFDFPSVNPVYKTRESRIGYFTKSKGNTIVFDCVSAIDFRTGQMKTYEFPEGHYCGEPIFAPVPEETYHLDQATEAGHLLTLVYDSTSDHSYLAVLKADALEYGPVAKIHLNHHSPISFHGHWEAKS